MFDQSKPSTALGTGSFACRSGLVRFDRSRDSSSRASIPEYAESWPGVAVSRNHDIISLDMNGNLAREANSPRLSSEILSTGRTPPSSSPKARVQPDRSTGSSYSTSASPAASACPRPPRPIHLGR